MDHQFVARALLLCGAVAASPATFACASCGCTLSSDWAELDFAASPGLKLDLRYDYLNQNQLRAGTHTISAPAASRLVNDGEPQEVETYTKNQYVSAGLDIGINPDWGINIKLPYVVRSHATLGTASDGVTAGPDGGQYHSRTSSIGDAKVVVRYQGFTPQHQTGLLFGLKLPTGSHALSGRSDDFQAPGAVAIDRGLQPGTGTTDVLLGAFAADALNQDWDYFAQVMVQHALQESDGYRAGNGWNVDAGLRYMGWQAALPQLQLNARHALRDSGVNADTVSTGGTLVYLSPGVSVPLNKRVSLYGFTQLPVYQKVNGVQLVPRYTLSIGARFAL